MNKKQLKKKKDLFRLKLKKLGYKGKGSKCYWSKINANIH